MVCDCTKAKFEVKNTGHARNGRIRGTVYHAHRAFPLFSAFGFHLLPAPRAPGSLGRELKAESGEHGPLSSVASREWKIKYRNLPGARAEILSQGSSKGVPHP